MGAYAPDAIRACWNTVKAVIPSAQLSGIYANKPGYHNARAQLGSGDYSVRRAEDKQGDPWAAAALDITLRPAEMKLLTGRLMAAARAGDRRLRAVREFFGTTNGTTVTGMDVPGKYNVTSDPTHLWHIHLSFNRRDTNDRAAMIDVANVMLAGGSAPAPPPPPPPQEEDMPKQLVLSNSTRKPLGKAGTWTHVPWNATTGAPTGGASLVLPDQATLFSMTAWLDLEGLPLDANLYWRVQTLDRAGKQLALYPFAEERGTSGNTGLALSQVGSVHPKTNLRLLVASTVDSTVIRAAQWRCFWW